MRIYPEEAKVIAFKTEENNVITIEKNIPIPLTSPQKRKLNLDFVRRMDIGDSFKINGNTPSLKPKAVRQYMYNLNSRKNIPMKFTVHTTRGHSINPSEIRVWRTE